MVDSRVAPHKSAKRIDYQHTEILSSVFSSRFSERLLVKRASYFGRESARCLRWNKKASSPSTVCSVVAESSDWIEILWPARRRTDFTRSVNGNSWLTFLLFFFFSLSLSLSLSVCLSLSLFPRVCSLFVARAKKADFLGTACFSGRKFYWPLRNRKRLDTCECARFPYSILRIRFESKERPSRDRRHQPRISSVRRYLLDANNEFASRIKKTETVNCEFAGINGVTGLIGRCVTRTMSRGTSGSLFNDRNIYFWFLAGSPLTKLMSSLTKIERQLCTLVCFQSYCFNYRCLCDG